MPTITFITLYRPCW